MPAEPAVKRTIAFLDGQNLYYAARECYGHTYPSYDVVALASAVCAPRGWKLVGTRFYTGIPDPAVDLYWHRFWSSNLASMGRQGVHIFSRTLRYHIRTVLLPGGGTHSFRAGEEKGVDVRLALDVVRLAHRNEYDVALVFSQDQDLSEVAEELRAISRDQNRWIKIASAYPCVPAASNRRGIAKTDWIWIDQATYDACRDPYDHRPKGRKQT